MAFQGKIKTKIAKTLMMTDKTDNVSNSFVSIKIETALVENEMKSEQINEAIKIRGINGPGFMSNQSSFIKIERIK